MDKVEGVKSDTSIYRYLGKFFRFVGFAIIVWIVMVGLVVSVGWLYMLLPASTMIVEDEPFITYPTIVELIGNLSSDPSEHYSDTGLAIARMSVATNHSWRDKQTGKWRKRTDWHQVLVFGKGAKRCIKKLSKGTRVRIIGRLQTDIIEDKHGQKRNYTKIIAQKIHLK